MSRTVAVVAMIAVGVLPIALRGGQSLSSPAPVTHFDKDRLSKPTYQVRVEHNVRVRMRDGVELSTDIFRPDAEGRFPALLTRTPYGKERSGVMSGGAYIPSFYAERGYVVVTQDTRGRFDSAGEFEPFRDEANDGFDTNEWIGQQPWSNGKIGGLGQSYFGITQLYQAIEGSRYLTTIAPIMTTLDAYNNWIYSDGAFHLRFAMPWGTGLHGTGRETRDAARRSPENRDAALRHAPLGTADEVQVGKPVPFYRDWMRHPTLDAYWQSRSPTDRWSQVSTPALVYTGWYDFFLRGALADYVALRQQGKTEAVRNGTRLIVGPWPHYTDNAGPPRQVADVDFGEASVVDLPRIQLRWFDYWLKGMPTGVAQEPPVKIFVMGTNVWRHEHEWPLARTRYTRYYLRSSGRANTLNGDGTLSTEAPQTGGRDTFTYDPANPVPSSAAGPADQRAVEQREDVLVYTGPALTHPVEVTGPITMNLFASTTARDTDFTAKLVAVHPDGTARILQDGIIRARYRTSRERPRLVTPGEIVEYAIDLWSTSHVLQPGHRLRVEISSSNFPRYDRNFNTGEDPATDTRMQPVTQTVYHGAAHPSHIVLPIIPMAEGIE